MDGKVYLARQKNLLIEPQANLVTSVAKPDEVSPFSGTSPMGEITPQPRIKPATLDYKSDVYQLS